LDESGLKGFNDSTFNGIFAPAGTPQAIINKLHTELSKILTSQDIQKRFIALGIEIAPSPTPAAFGQYIQSQITTYQDLVRKANIKAD
jgi:tripartite-type tricarboxylate transporter receptor subunit TctC